MWFRSNVFMIMGNFYLVHSMWPTTRWCQRLTGNELNPTHFSLKPIHFQTINICFGKNITTLHFHLPKTRSCFVNKRSADDSRVRLNARHSPASLFCPQTAADRFCLKIVYLFLSLNGTVCNPHVFQEKSTTNLDNPGRIQNHIYTKHPVAYS